MKISVLTVEAQGRAPEEGSGQQIGALGDVAEQEADRHGDNPHSSQDFWFLFG